MAVKNEVLKYLEENRNESVSGQELADKIGVTRAAVWKAVKALENEGYKIHASTNRGYRLEKENDILSAEGIRIHLDPKYTETELQVLDTVDSTNTYAKKQLALGKTEDLIVLAEQQTGGRGRQGKSFFSPRGSGLYISLAVHPRLRLEDSSFLTILAAVAVCRTIETTLGLEPKIKWVNDVFLDGKKICGILSEAVTDFESGVVESVVVGIGINCRQNAFPPELLGHVGWLGCADVSRNRLAAVLINHFFDILNTFDRNYIVEEYKKRSFLPGREITFLRSGETVRARVLDINEKGNLVVCLPGGETVVLSSGEVSIGSDTVG